MPYLVTTAKKRRAVATLGDAKATSHIACQAACDSTFVPGRFVLAVEGLTEAGGTVGPLPDGSLIEVEPVGAIDLFNRAGLPKGPPYKTVAQVLAAFNEANR